jgi:hypothetical protein
MAPRQEKIPTEALSRPFCVPLLIAKTPQKAITRVSLKTKKKPSESQEESTTMWWLCGGKAKKSGCPAKRENFQFNFYILNPVKIIL